MTLQDITMNMPDKLPDSHQSPAPGADPHIAHEDHANRSPSPGGVPDGADTGKTAPPDGGWVDVGTTYGGLRGRPGAGRKPS